jgi:hypothetical protein
MSRPRYRSCVTRISGVSTAIVALLRTTTRTGMAQERGVPAGETGVTVFAAEAPRTFADLAARTPDELSASLAEELAWIGYQSALLVVGPDLGGIFRAGGWDRARVRRELSDSGPDDVLLAHAGGDAGRFVMVYRGWVAGDAGSQPVTRSVSPWLVTILDPTAESAPAGRPLARERLSPGRAATIALLDISKPRGAVFFDELERLLRARGHEIVRMAKPTFTKTVSPDVRAEILERLCWSRRRRSRQPRCARPPR